MATYGTILQFKRFAVHDGNGIRTTLFLKGCPLRCVWCHNPEGISSKPELALLQHKCMLCGDCVPICPSHAHRITDGQHTLDRTRCVACGACADACLGEAITFYGRKITAEDAAAQLLCDRNFYETSGGGITISGGEPLMQPEFTAEVFRLVHQAGVATALDTCGMAPRSAFDRVLPFTDRILFDVKAFSPEIHRKYTGCDNRLILENLVYCNTAGIPIEIRIPLIPTVNDGEIEAIAEFLAPMHAVTAVRVLPYHAYARTKYTALGLNYHGEAWTVPEKPQLLQAIHTLQKHGLSVICSGITDQ